MGFPSSTQRALLGLALLAAACRAGSGGAGGARNGEPLQLERLMVGSVYGVGSRFESDGLRFHVKSFDGGLGNAEIAAAEPARADAKAKGDPAKALQLAHATLHCQGRKAGRMDFDFVDGGGQVSLEIDGERRGEEDFIALDGAELGGAKIAVSEEKRAGVRRGSVSVTGPIETFAIGGADLRLVDLRLSSER